MITATETNNPQLALKALRVSLIDQAPDEQKSIVRAISAQVERLMHSFPALTAEQYTLTCSIDIEGRSFSFSITEPE